MKAIARRPLKDCWEFMMSWREGKVWSDKFIPQINAILGICLFTEPAVVEDQKHNTDLTMVADNIRVSCRVRKFADFDKYGGEFTIRYKLASGAPTEIDKIMDGWGTYGFYAFASEDEKSFHQWLIYDLDVFRKCYPDSATYRSKCRNVDGRSSLAAFWITDFPPEFKIGMGGDYHGITISDMMAIS